MTKRLCIGDTSQQTLVQAQQVYPAAQLVDQTNFKQVLDQSQGEFFSALGDLDFNQLKRLALSCQQVILLTDLPWSDTAAHTQTKILCNHLSHFCNVQGFSLLCTPNFGTVTVTRQHATPTVWTFGCSHTAGVGLVDPDSETYGAKLAARLSMPWQNVAQSGSSLWWSLDHLVQADVKAGDIVIWGTTAAERTRIARSFESVDEVMVVNLNPKLLEYFTDEQLYFNHFNLINIGVEYLRRRQINFALLSLIPNTKFLDIVETQLSRYREWCPVPGWYSFDLGTDGMHSGPLGHEYVANQLYDHVHLLRYV